MGFVQISEDFTLRFIDFLDTAEMSWPAGIKLYTPKIPCCPAQTCGEIRKADCVLVLKQQLLDFSTKEPRKKKKTFHEILVV